MADNASQCNLTAGPLHDPDFQLSNINLLGSFQTVQHKEKQHLHLQLILILW